MPFFRSMCVHLWVRSAARLGTAHPYKPLLHFGTALIAHHRTGLIPAHIGPGTKSTPAHIGTGTKSIPHPHQHCERVHPQPTSALVQPSPHLHRNRVHAQAHICAATAGLRDICLCATQVCCNHMHCVATTCCVATECHLCTIDPVADGTRCHRLHAAALPCHRLHPIQAKRSKAKRRRRWPNRVACARHCGRGWAST